jgi:hypothetical protein
LLDSLTGLITPDLDSKAFMFGESVLGPQGDDGAPVAPGLQAARGRSRLAGSLSISCVAAMTTCRTTSAAPSGEGSSLMMGLVEAVSTPTGEHRQCGQCAATRREPTGARLNLRSLALAVLQKDSQRRTEASSPRACCWARRFFAAALPGLVANTAPGRADGEREARRATAGARKPLINRRWSPLIALDFLWLLSSLGRKSDQEERPARPWNPLRPRTGLCPAGGDRDRVFRRRSIGTLQAAIPRLAGVDY